MSSNKRARQYIFCDFGFGIACGIDTDAIDCWLTDRREIRGRERANVLAGSPVVTRSFTKGLFGGFQGWERLVLGIRVALECRLAFSPRRVHAGHCSFPDDVEFLLS